MELLYRLWFEKIIIWKFLKMKDLVWNVNYWKPVEFLNFIVTVGKGILFLDSFMGLLPTALIILIVKAIHHIFLNFQLLTSGFTTKYTLGCEHHIIAYDPESYRVSSIRYIKIGNSNRMKYDDLTDGSMGMEAFNIETRWIKRHCHFHFEEEIQSSILSSYLPPYFYCYSFMDNMQVRPR